MVLIGKDGQGILVVDVKVNSYFMKMGFVIIDEFKILLWIFILTKNESVVEIVSNIGSIISIKVEFPHFVV